MHTENFTCSFTGHRNIPRPQYHEIADRLREKITRLYGIGVRHFIAGGAMGFDLIAAVVVLDFKKTHSDITLELAIPCPKHNASWDMSDRELFKTVCEAADEVNIISPEYDRGCMFRRNRYMVDKSEYLIAYCTRTTGGSYYTVNYAEKKGINILFV